MDGYRKTATLLPLNRQKLSLPSESRHGQRPGYESSHKGAVISFAGKRDAQRNARAGDEPN